MTLLVFVRAPRVGTVKTRLAREIGAAGALDAYLSMVSTLLPVLREFSGSIEFRFTPDDARREIQAWVPPTGSAVPQGGGHLGDRLSRAFKDCFHRGAKSVAAIGTDCPEITSEDLHAAAAAVETNGADAVLGPAADGGYWLIGMNRFQPELFQDMPWSSDQLLDATRRRAAQQNLRVHDLRVLHDIDTRADWERWSGRLGNRFTR